MKDKIPGLKSRHNTRKPHRNKLFSKTMSMHFSDKDTTRTNEKADSKKLN